MLFIWALLLEIWDWLWRLGGLGLILMGLIDSSVIPTPGGLDALTIILAANRKDSWLYYAVMAVIGSVLGGYVTYRLGRKGGEEALEQKLSKKKVQKVRRAFERWGFGTIFISSILPPPVPLGPFLLGAGALNYPLKKFLAALAAGRTIRFTLVAYFASRYGHQVYDFLAENSHVVLIVFIALLVIGAIVAIVYIARRRARKKEPKARPAIKRRA
jgi:membrane protein DedA with SNARE-associated domain